MHSPEEVTTLHHARQCNAQKAPDSSLLNPFFSKTKVWEFELDQLQPIDRELSARAHPCSVTAKEPEGKTTTKTSNNN